MSDIEDLASHDGPDSCAYIRKAAPEELTGVPTDIHASQSFRAQVQRHWLRSRRCGLVSVGACSRGRPFWIFYRRLLRRNGWGIIPWDGKYPPVRVLPGWESCRVNCLVAARDGCVCMPLGKASNLAR